MPLPCPMTARPTLARAATWFALATLAAAQQPAPETAADPSASAPTRELLRTLAARPRVAGTRESLHAVEFVARELERAGWRVERERFDVVLSLPRRIAFAIHAAGAGEPLVQRVETWDPDAERPGDIPKFAGWTASGKVRARAVDVGRGLRADYERLAASGVDVRGKIALATFGGAYRGIKVDMAAEHGCAGVLLYSPSDEDGADRGPVWPAGPWKPGHDAQRGSISPMGRAPGDPSTPGWPSTAGCARVPAGEYAMPKLLCLPIGWDDAHAILERIADVEVELEIDAPPALRPIYNVVGTLAARGSAALVVAGSHRDSWVRGAHDSGGGCAALLRAAQILGARAKQGWDQHGELRVCFWDAEEQGLVGSTEHVEAHRADYAARLVAYVNSDANVSGTRFGASGTPGMMRVLRETCASIDSVATPGRSLWDEYTQGGTKSPAFSLPGSGSDFAAFVHHAGLPMLELGFGGGSGGQYHTTFDDFELVDRFLDPGFAAHEKCAEATAALLARLAEQGRAAFDAGEACKELARHARLAGLEKSDGGASWLGEARAERLAAAFDALAAAPPDALLPAAFLRDAGIPGRAWFKNPLWAPGLETGYSSETFPTLRRAARDGEAALERELAALLDTATALQRSTAPPR
ncbi:MAG: M28 family peptidase [Planctomycetota bacterium]|nr:MAG: M28 family peptidase [Planctomycetota bacterium]